jgi:hypothetical protein
MVQFDNLLVWYLLTIEVLGRRIIYNAPGQNGKLYAA